MSRRRVIPVVVLAFLLSLVVPTASTADVEPPWCGTPTADAAGNLPDGTQPGHPVGSFPHIPYYAIRCTLEDIVAQQPRAACRWR